MSESERGLDFSELLVRAAAGYEPRGEAEAAVLGAIGEGPGCIVVTGGPGSGKTTIAAHLIATHGWCRHFLRVGHTEFTLWRDPYACLASMAFQLQDRFGDDIFPESVAIDARGTIHDVTRTGSVAAVDIERLVALPWRRERIQVDLDARHIAGDVTGVRIGELVENYRSLPLPAFRELALVEPLRRLRTRRPDAQVVLWVDGLDEDDAGHDGASWSRESVTAILPIGSDCRRLGNLTLVVSARPGRHLGRFVEDGARHIDLDADTLAPETGRVLAAVIERELHDPQVRDALEAIDWPAADVSRDLVAASEGSFLFVRQSLEAVRSGLGESLRAGGLPRGLDEIHARILSTLIRGLHGDERDQVLATLATLAVARVPVSAAQIARFAGRDEAGIRQAVLRLRPLLDAEPGDPERYGCYHASLRDSLTARRHANASWHVDAEAAHLRLGAAYVQPDGSARGVDGYGLLFSAWHLSQAGPEGTPRLLEVLHDGWRALCRQGTGSNRLFRESLGLARERAAALPMPDALLTTIRLALMDVYIRSAERQMPLDAIEVMVRLGHVQRAIESVPDDLDAVECARRHQAIVRGLMAQEGGEAALATRLLEQAFERLHARPEWLPFEMADLLDEWPLDRLTDLEPAFGRMEPAVLQGTPPAAALAACARVATRLAPGRANDLFRAAFDAAMAGGRDPGDRTFGRLLTAWAAFDAAAAREHVQARGSIRLDAAAAAGFLRLSLALERQGWAGSFVQGARFILDLPASSERDPVVDAGMQLEVARHGAGVLDTETLRAILERVRSILAARRAARVSEGADADRIAGEVPVLVGLAEVERQIDPSAGDEALAVAWQAVLDGDRAGDEDLDRLVRLQRDADADLLEAYLHSAPEALAARLRFSLVRTGTWPGHDGAREALEQVIRRSEQPRATGWSMYYYGVASRCAPDTLAWWESVLDGAGVHPSLIVRWRVAAMRRLVAAGHPDAADWLRTTVERWGRQRPNANFADELPALVASLPVELVDVVEPLVPAIPHPPLRRLVAAAIGRARFDGGRPDADAWFAQAGVEDGEEADGTRDLQEYSVRSFVAGQLWSVDPARAGALWDDAQARLEARLPMADAQGPTARARYLQACEMLRHLQGGAPAVAVPALLALREPLPEPGTRYLVTPFPSVSPYRVANLAEHEHVLGDTLARVQPVPGDLVEQVLAGPLSAAGSAFVRIRLAASPTPLPIPRRLAWCQEAAAAAGQVAWGPLRALLLADAACATAIVGARGRAMEVARAAVSGMDGHLVQADAVIAHVYGAALGRCVAAAFRCREGDAAWTWLWQGRVLGMHGFHVLLGEVAEVTQDVAGVPADALLEAEARGRNLYLQAAA